MTKLLVNWSTSVFCGIQDRLMQIMKNKILYIRNFMLLNKTEKT